ncbi:MAG: nuclear transport factor 2 family protein [Gemmatimonadales bacterium]
MRMAFATVALALAFAGPARAQSEEKAVVQAITRLFDGMRTRDTALMRSLMAPEARLLGIGTESGQPKLQTIDPSLWIASVGRGSGPGADEKIFDPIVHVDGNIAQVWVYYELWLGTRLSHCGYDAFFMAKLADGWKVAQVADTRRTDCTPRG